MGETAGRIRIGPDCPGFAGSAALSERRPAANEKSSNTLSDKNPMRGILEAVAAVLLFCLLHLYLNFLFFRTAVGTVILWVSVIAFAVNVLMVVGLVICAAYRRFRGRP